jgi:hypothetical protein
LEAATQRRRFTLAVINGCRCNKEIKENQRLRKALYSMSAT